MRPKMSERPAGDIWSQPASRDGSLSKLIAPKVEQADPAEEERLQREIEELLRPYNSSINSHTLDKILR